MKVNNSLERMLTVLDAFSENQLEWTSEELIDRLGYSRPTMYRYLKALRESGFLTALPNGGFTLGPRFVEMDYLLRRSDPLVLHGRALIEELADSHPCTALLVRWYRAKVLCVDSSCSVEDAHSSYPRGRPMPLARGALARAIIAFLPRRQLVPFVERNLDEFRSVNLGTTAEEVLARLRATKRTGVAIAHGEVTPGVVGIAAPVFDSSRSPIASLGVTVSGQRVTGTEIESIGTKVRESAAALTEVLTRKRSQQSSCA